MFHRWAAKPEAEKLLWTPGVCAAMLCQAGINILLQPFALVLLFQPRARPCCPRSRVTSCSSTAVPPNPARLSGDSPGTATLPSPASTSSLAVFNLL